LPYNTKTLKIDLDMALDIDGPFYQTAVNHYKIIDGPNNTVILENDTGRVDEEQKNQLPIDKPEIEGNDRVQTTIHIPGKRGRPRNLSPGGKSRKLKKAKVQKRQRKPRVAPKPLEIAVESGEPINVHSQHLEGTDSTSPA